MSNAATFTVTPSGDREIVFTRSFDAPRRLVWKAMTNPDLIRKWLFGPPGWTMTACDEDSRPGGAFRWAWRGPAGEDMQMRGVYREVVPPAANGAGGRIVRTETFEFGCAAQAGEQVCTMVLTDDGRRTRMTLTVAYPNKQARDGALASGMEHGMSAGYNRLDELLAADQ